MIDLTDNSRRLMHFPQLGGPMKRVIVCVALLFPASLSVCSAQEFSVLLIDACNGHPLPNETVTVTFTENDRAPKGFTVKTDANGTATFQLPTPLPPNVPVRNYDLYPCYQLTPANTRALKKYGLVSRCSKQDQACQCNLSKEASEIKANPGQIVLLARPETLWESLVAELPTMVLSETRGLQLFSNRGVLSAIAWFRQLTITEMGRAVTGRGVAEEGFQTGDLKMDTLAVKPVR
jgi:hypothetical protein